MDNIEGSSFIEIECLIKHIMIMDARPKMSPIEK